VEAAEAPPLPLLASIIRTTSNNSNVCLDYARAFRLHAVVLEVIFNQADK